MVRLTRGFSTTPSNEKMSPVTSGIKTVIALSLGFFPFVVSAAALTALKKFSQWGLKSKNRAVCLFCAAPASCCSALFFVSAKIFGITQLIVWRNYAKHPIGDRLNTRLAWYGLQTLAQKDFWALQKAWFAPAQLKEGEFSLEQWSQIQI